MKENDFISYSDQVRIENTLAGKMSQKLAVKFNRGKKNLLKQSGSFKVGERDE